ncbi:NAD(P)H dehydrogenase (quinone) [Agrobacterium vitis]|nr:NAD(P)H dehydrogenase (quinone) [Agrobacterium vitis]MBE1436512.1 NAD(P)H dehydrogenase (quinone) [Agrobacterium vitis]
MFGVTGATGQLGQKVIKSLLSRVSADQIVALVRDPAKAGPLGVQARAADYFVPASLEDSLTGVQSLLLISSSSMENRAQQHENVINAAKKAGVQHIVYTSLLHADRWTHWFSGDHTRTEAALKASGVTYTILRNGWYWENHTVAIAPSLAHGALIGSAGEGLVSWASRQDFADAAVRVLATPGHERKTYELAGDKAYRLADLAAEVTRQTGKPYSYQNLTEAQHAGVLEQIGLPKMLAEVVAGVEAQGVSTGVLHDDDGALSQLIGRPTTTLSEAVAEALAAPVHM